MKGRPRLGVRTRLLVAVLLAVALALAAGVTAFNALLGWRLSASATALARAEAEAVRSGLEVRDGKLASPEGPGVFVGGLHWVFAGVHPVESPRVTTPQLDALARSLATGPERYGEIYERTRLYALPVVVGGKRLGTVVAGISLDAYQETGRFALFASLGLAAVLLGAVAVLARWILGRALEPVSRMTAAAMTWSDQDLDRRFDLGEPYDELTRLAATLDAMLERLAASLRHEQRFTAELSHELRTPLAKIVAETEIALWRTRTSDEYRASLEAVHRSAEQMTRTVEALVSAARQEVGLTAATSDARVGVRRAVESIEADADESGLAVRLALPDAPVRVAIAPELLERIVQPLLDNAVRYGRSEIAVELVRNGAAAYVEVADDGAGVAEEELERIFEPGVRGGAAAGSPGGAGLGLALAQRLARSAGGEIIAESGSGGRFTVRMPVA